MANAQGTVSREVVELVGRVNAVITLLKSTLEAKDYDSNSDRTKKTLFMQYKNNLLPLRKSLNTPDTQNLRRLADKILRIIEESFKQAPDKSEYIFLTPTDHEEIIGYCKDILTIRQTFGSAAA